MLIDNNRGAFCINKLKGKELLAFKKNNNSIMCSLFCYAEQYEAFLWKAFDAWYRDKEARLFYDKIEIVSNCKKYCITEPIFNRLFP